MRNLKSQTPPRRSFGRRASGQGLTEYIIVLALVAVAAITAVSFFGAAIKGQFVQLGSEMIGAPDTSGVEAAAEVQGQATARNGASTLGDYGNGGGN